MQHQQQIQEEFFSVYHIADVTEHVVRPGESLWILAQRRYNERLFLGSLAAAQTKLRDWLSQGVQAEDRQDLVDMLFCHLGKAPSQVGRVALPSAVEIKFGARPPVRRGLPGGP